MTSGPSTSRLVVARADRSVGSGYGRAVFWAFAVSWGWWFLGGGRASADPCYTDALSSTPCQIESPTVMSGLAQLSDQLQGLAAFLMVFAVLVVFCLGFLAVLVFVGRR